MTQRIYSALAVITLLVVLYIAFQTQHVVNNMEDNPPLSGQYVESHGVRTERYMDEPDVSWRARHMEAIGLFRVTDEGK